jgi:hypothetical protein
MKFIHLKINMLIMCGAEAELLYRRCLLPVLPTYLFQPTSSNRMRGLHWPPAVSSKETDCQCNSALVKKDEKADE